MSVVVTFEDDDVHRPFDDPQSLGPNSIDGVDDPEDDVFFDDEDILTSSQQNLLDGVLMNRQISSLSKGDVSLPCFGKEVRFPLWAVLCIIFVCLLIAVILVASLAVAVTELAFIGGDQSSDSGDETADSMKPTVLLISIDGFRYDYFEKYPNKTGNLSMLIGGGVKATSMQPVFPSKTFPNHYSIATGLYPESHGIVGNTMYDPVFDATFTLSSKDPRWWQGEPIWITAERQGQKAGAVFWPGTDVNISGTLPSYYLPFDGSMAYSSRVDKVLEYLSYPSDKRPTFVTLYFEAVDHAGHVSGPDSPDIPMAMYQVDDALGQLLDGLRAMDALDAINVVITSDHGMTGLSSTRVVLLNDVDALRGANIITTTPILSVIPNNRSHESDILSEMEHIDHVDCYSKENIPNRLHFTRNRRITPIVCIAEIGWSLSKNGNINFGGGTHGYDIAEKDMQAIFVAHGPAFKKGVVVESFSNLHVYSLIAHILGLDPAPNNGSLSSIESVLA